MTYVGEMELDGEQEGSSEGETWHSQESSDSESESEPFVHSEDGEENSDDENDIGGLGDEIDDITEEVESDDE